MDREKSPIWNFWTVHDGVRVAQPEELECAHGSPAFASEQVDERLFRDESEQIREAIARKNQ